MSPIVLLTTLLAYLLGSLPIGVVAARIFGWPDPRTHGSGHTGGRNAMRGGGLLAGVLVTALDVGKGALAVWLAGRLAAQPSTLAVALAGAAVVAGHCWPFTLGFKGGMGLATSAGAFASHALWVPFLAALLWLLLTRIVRHQARAMMAVALLVLPILWLVPFGAETRWLGTSLLAVLLLRHLADWNRVYH